MGKINNQVIEIRNWLNSDRNYNDGVFLYNKYGNNDSLKRIFPGREKFQAQKLAYELAKLAGFSFSDFLKDQVIQEEVTPVSPQKNTTENNEDTGLTGQTNRKMIEYPPLIRRVIHEMSRLYNDRSMLKTQQNAIPDENTPANVEKRKNLVDMIEALSGRIQLLFEAKKAYLERGIIPDENALFPPEESKQSIEELQTRLKNLRSYISKDKNILVYQRETRQEKPNPMPDSPKKERILKRIEKNEKEVQELEKRIKDATDNN